MEKERIIHTLNGLVEHTILSEHAPHALIGREINSRRALLESAGFEKDDVEKLMVIEAESVEDFFDKALDVLGVRESRDPTSG